MIITAPSMIRPNQRTRSYQIGGDPPRTMPVRVNSIDINHCRR